MLRLAMASISAVNQISRDISAVRVAAAPAHGVVKMLLCQVGPRAIACAHGSSRSHHITEPGHGHGHLTPHLSPPGIRKEKG